MTLSTPPLTLTLPIISLLRACAEDSDNLDPKLFDEGALSWALETGLGPLLYRAIRNHSNVLTTEPCRSRLVSADLTAQIMVGECLNAVDEILAASPTLAKEITLLKGISVCQCYYPSPHLRTMGDIDLLVSKAFEPALESLLSNLGYRQQSIYPAEFYEKLHHRMPYFHPQKQVWVEVHTALFPLLARVGGDRIFSLGSVEAQINPCVCLGKERHHLSDELQIVYLSSHWAGELKRVGGLMPVLDMIYLLKSRETRIDWDLILSLLEGSVAATRVYLMLTYLQRHELAAVPKVVVERLSSMQKNLNDASTSILHRLVDTYLVAGKPYSQLASEANIAIIWGALLEPRLPLRNLLSLPWRLLFPPGNPHRFDPRFQLRRIGSAVGLRR